jgi:hypothetical protein
MTDCPDCPKVPYCTVLYPYGGNPTDHSSVHEHRGPDPCSSRLDGRHHRRLHLNSASTETLRLPVTSMGRHAGKGRHRTRAGRHGADYTGETAAVSTKELPCDLCRPADHVFCMPYGFLAFHHPLRCIIPKTASGTDDSKPTVCKMMRPVWPAGGTSAHKSKVELTFHMRASHIIG